VPGQTACLLCNHLRVTRNLDYYQEYRSWEKWLTTEGKRKRATPGTLAPFTDLIASMAAIELLKQSSSLYEPETYNKFITVNALTLEFVTHQVQRLPRCPACGNARNKVSFSPWQEI
jgi:bacteriocin biosynthesis cyclodehydratase domain-containing protein